MDDEDLRVRNLRFMGDQATQPAAIFEALVRLRWPEIAWRRPIDMATPSRTGLGCRLCIAQHGFRAEDGQLFSDVETFAAHLIDKHPLY